MKNKRRIKKSAVLALMILIGLFSGCEGTPPPEVTITNIGWYFLNMDEEYEQLIWGYNNNGALYFDFSIYYEGDELDSTKLAAASALMDDIQFNVPVERDVYFPIDEEDNRYRIDGYYYWRDDELDELPLGPWEFELELSDGSIQSFSKTFNLPGSTDVVSGAYIMNEDSTVSAGNYYSMVKRAAIQAVSYDDSNDELTVDFIINDDSARSGYVRLFDENGDFIGSSSLFIDSSNEASSGLNSDIFYTEGTPNSFSVSMDEFTDVVLDMSQVYYAVVVILDGKQYQTLTSGGAYDCRSYSAPRQVTLP